MTVREAIRAFLLTATDSEVQRELEISERLKENFRVQCIREIQRERELERVGSDEQQC